MAGLGVRIFTDEQIPDALARALRGCGYDAVGRGESGRANQGISDEAQLVYATQEGRALLTFDRIDFLELDVEWKRSGMIHSGIMLTRASQDIGELLRRVERHLNTHPPTAQDTVLLWLEVSPTRE